MKIGMVVIFVLACQTIWTLYECFYCESCDEEDNDDDAGWFESTIPWVDVASYVDNVV